MMAAVKGSKLVGRMVCRGVGLYVTPLFLFFPDRSGWCGGMVVDYDLALGHNHGCDPVGLPMSNVERTTRHEHVPLSVLQSPFRVSVASPTTMLALAPASTPAYL